MGGGGDSEGKKKNTKKELTEEKLALASKHVPQERE